MFAVAEDPRLIEGAQLCLYNLAKVNNSPAATVVSTIQLKICVHRSTEVILTTALTSLGGRVWIHSQPPAESLSLGKGNANRLQVPRRGLYTQGGDVAWLSRKEIVQHKPQM